MESLSVIGSGSEVCAWKQLGFEIEGIAQAVRGVDAHDQRAVAELGKFYAGRGGQAGFADTALSAEEKNPHRLNYKADGCEKQDGFGARLQRPRAALNSIAFQ